MRIGILTFHSQLNYGGVLQCWALKHALLELGREVVVIDRWLGPDNWLLERGYNHFGLKQWLKWLLHALIGCGNFAPWLRHWRTKRFVKALGLTPYHFYEWKDAPKDLGIDCIIVGSDQVWHGGKGTWAYPTPDPYLLKDAPRVPAISYAASFGMKALPPDVDYAEGVKRFQAISVREEEGVQLVESVGGRATHVVDPTLLLARDAWNSLGKYKKRKKSVVCYCLKEEIEDKKQELEIWARKTGRQVTIISENALLLPFPKTPKKLFQRIGVLFRNTFHPSKVRIVTSYGPREFYRAFAEAEECITNSFHAVMFSYICGCNVRVLKPQDDDRKDMFARIEEFTNSVIRGMCLVDSLSEALHSLSNAEHILFNEEDIEKRRTDSHEWLVKVLASINSSINI